MRVVLFLMLLLGWAGGAWAGCVGDVVELRIISDNQSELSVYPVPGRSTNRKAYAEATKGEQYGIAVRNRLDRRVGIVVAVDGRNIITGKQSRLESGEQMYILEPYAEAEFKGWRTGEDRINRFYFTTAADSYAAAFGDQSAMGVIAMAVYPEVKPYDPPVHIYEGASNSPVSEMPKSGMRAKAAKSSMAPKPAPAPSPAPMPAPSSSAGSSASMQELNSDAADKSAGTGYGREEYSPLRYVSFEPESVALEKVYLKYEWRETLCRKGIVACGGHRSQPDNRFWNEDGFAAPPPGRN
jgi:hypothetical protein